MKVFATLTLLILFLFSPCSSDALTLAMPSWDFNIANLVKHTDLVVLGKVTGMRLIPEAHSTSITLSVESVIKGDPAVGDRLLRFTVMGRAGMKKHRGKRILWDVEGSLEFRLGERLLLFMKKYRGDYHVFLHHYGKRIVTDNKVFIPYTYKTNRFSDYYNEMREVNVQRYVELPLYLVVKVAKASIKDYNAIMAIEAEVSKAVSLTREERQHGSPRTTLSVELLKRLEEIALQILGKRAEGLGISRLESVNGERKSIADESVELPDPNLRTEIERELGRMSIAPITAADMESLTTLYADRADISDLTGLEAAINLKKLDLAVNNISDLSPLLELTNLTQLSLSQNELADISSLSGLTNLTQLDLLETGISDISSLSGLTNLTHLWLHYNSISDISSLSGLTNLILLRLDDNSISDISTLSELTNLTRLWLGDNNISDISPLLGLTNLTRLELQKNNLSDISSLSGLINLTELRLQANGISDISAVSGLTNLTDLYLRGNTISDLLPLVSNAGLGTKDTVDVSSNPLSAASINTHIPTLQSRGVRVRLE